MSSSLSGRAKRRRRQADVHVDASRRGESFCEGVAGWRERKFGWPFVIRDREIFRSHCFRKPVNCSA